MTPTEPVLVLLPLPGAVCLWGRECTVVGLSESLTRSFGYPVWCVRGRDGRIAYGPEHAFLRLSPTACVFNLVKGKP